MKYLIKTDDYETEVEFDMNPIYTSLAEKYDIVSLNHENSIKGLEERLNATLNEEEMFLLKTKLSEDEKNLINLLNKNELSLNRKELRDYLRVLRGFDYGNIEALVEALEEASSDVLIKIM